MGDSPLSPRHDPDGIPETSNAPGTAAQLLDSPGVLRRGRGPRASSAEEEPTRGRRILSRIPACPGWRSSRAGQRARQGEAPARSTRAGSSTRARDLRPSTGGSTTTPTGRWWTRTGSSTPYRPPRPPGPDPEPGARTGTRPRAGARTRAGARPRHQNQNRTSRTSPWYEHRSPSRSPSRSRSRSRSPSRNPSRRGDPSAPPAEPDRDPPTCRASWSTAPRTSAATCSAASSWSPRSRP